MSHPAQSHWRKMLFQLIKTFIYDCLKIFEATDFLKETILVFNNKKKKKMNYISNEISIWQETLICF